MKTLKKKTKTKTKKIERWTDNIQPPNKKVAISYEVAEILGVLPRNVFRTAKRKGFSAPFPLVKGGKVIRYANGAPVKLFRLPEEYHRHTKYQTSFYNSGAGFYLFIREDGSFEIVNASVLFGYSLMRNGMVIGKKHRLGLTDNELDKFFEENQSVVRYTCDGNKELFQIQEDIESPAIRAIINLLKHAGRRGVLYSAVDEMPRHLRDEFVTRFARNKEDNSWLLSILDRANYNLPKMNVEIIKE